MMTKDDKEVYEIIISGAGPSGLSAAILSARKGMDVLVIEKEDKVGKYPRGETIHNHPIFDEILGNGFMESIALHHAAGRKFNSPNSLKSFQVERKSASIVFEWDLLMEKLFENAKKEGVNFLFEYETQIPILEGDICIGVKVKDKNGKERDLFANTVIAADGHTSKLAKFSGVDFSKINCGMIKCLISNFSSDYPDFEYFLIPTGALDFAPRFPPSVTFIFPREEGKAEIGLMIFQIPAEKLAEKGLCDIPNEEELVKVWEKLINKYPRFSDIVKNAKIEHQYPTYIPNARVYDDPMPIPGLMLLGDAFGFVEESGASGIYCSMEAAKHYSNFIANKSKNDEKWDVDKSQTFREFFFETEIYKHIVKVHKLITIGLKIIFVKFRTPEKINSKWRWRLIEKLFSRQ